ncbi:20089_t:CDS:2, partial [Gigaspora rosea]
MSMAELHKNLLFGPRTLHATLRMVFQYTIPVPIYGISEARAIMLPNNKRPIFETSSYALETLNIFSYVFKELL